MLTLLLLLQATPAPAISPEQWLTSLPSLGVGGAMAMMVFWFYRVDRKESEARVLKITENFLQVIQDNTKAMTSVVDAISKIPQR